MATELEVITKQLEELPGQVGEMVTKSKEEISKTVQSIDDEVGKVKANLQEIQVKMDEQDKRMAAKFEQEERSQKSFSETLYDAVMAKEDDINKFLRKEKGYDRVSIPIERKAVGDVTTSNVTGGSLYGQQMRPGIIEAPKRKVHMRSLLPVAQAGPGNTYTFMRENGDGEGAIAPVAEGGTKPQIDVDLVEATVNFETIAGWLRVTRKAMNNIPGFVAFLQSRLPEKLLKIEDSQILYGTGTTPQIKGILVSGNFTASTATLADPLVEKIIDDIAALEDTHEREADAILLRPVEYYNFFKNKASGSGEYDLPANVTFANGRLYISGIPVYATTALVDPDYVVGDFSMGAQLLIQEAMRIEFFEQDADNVTKNKVTVRIEETIALPVFGNNYFIKGSTATS